MPNVSDFDKEDEWMGACVPKMMDEGRDQEQAVAACRNMWGDKSLFNHFATIEEAIKYFLKIGNHKSILICMDLCRWCVQACIACMKACSASGNMNDEIMKNCMEACHHCIAACEFCASVCETENVNAIAKACQDCVTACQVCEEACDVCAKIYPEMAEVCLLCSDVCSRCARECQAVQGNPADMENMKIGARHTHKEMAAFQTVHDIMVENGAMCQKTNGKSEPVEEVIAYGSTIKAVKLDDGSVKFTGPLISYGAPDQTDLTADYFDSQTDYGEVKESDVYFNHRLPIEIDGQKIEYKQRMGRAQLIQTDQGVIAEVILKARNAYEKAIVEAGLAGALGWSSGTAGHLVEREPVGKAYHVKSWPLGLDASLTPTPAEPRNQVIPLKSLIPSKASPSSAKPAGPDKDSQTKTIKESIMDKDEFKALLAENNKTIIETVKAEAKAAAAAAVSEELDKLPEIKARLGNVHVEVDEADRPFKSVAEQMLAIKNISSGRVDPRMKRIQNISHQWMEGNEEAKALLGSNEVIPSQGEFLLEPTISAEFLKPLHDEGPITKLAKRMPVGPNSTFGWINGVDETSRATGSRWGGVRGYWLSAGDTMTASQPKFKRINWELNQLAVLQYATDNMLRDAQLMDSVIRQSALEELNFMVNDAFFRGTGAGQPKGLGTAATNAALISAVRTNATNIDHDDITRMIARVPARAHSRLVWLANPDIMPELDTLNFTAGSTGILSPYVTYTADGVTMLRGRPVVYNEFSPTLGSVGDLLLWDPQDYLYWEGSGVEGASSIHVQFLTNQTVFRFIYRVDGMPASYSAMTRYQSTDTESAYVALAATT